MPFLSDQAPFAAQAAADCDGKKVNLRFIFDSTPTLQGLLDTLTDAFGNLYRRHNIHRIFDVSAAVVFNDDRCTWDRLESASQLYLNCQLYLFQPNLPESSAEIPRAVDGGPLLPPPAIEDRRDGSNSRPQHTRSPSPAVASHWLAPRLKLAYGGNVIVTSRPNFRSAPAPKQYCEFVPSTGRFALREGPIRGARHADGTPVGTSPKLAHQGTYSACEGSSEQITDDTIVGPASGLRTAPSTRGRLLSPPRDDDDDNANAAANLRSRVHPLSLPDSLASVARRPPSPVDYRAKYLGSYRPSIQRSAYSPSGTRYPSPPPHPSVREVTVNADARRAEPPSCSRTPPLSPSRSTSPAPMAVSPRAERAKAQERMQMPLDELRRNLQLETDEMGRSLGRQRSASRSAQGW